MDEIFAYKPSEDDDYYLILGCDELSSVFIVIFSKIFLIKFLFFANHFQCHQLIYDFNPKREIGSMAVCQRHGEYKVSFSYLSSDTESINFLSSPQVWGGWLNLEFSQGKIKHLGWTIKTIYKI